MSIESLTKVIRYYDIPIKGLFHVGAAFCEERLHYKNILEIDDSKVIWVDAIQENVDLMSRSGVPNCYQAVIDLVERDTLFNITTFPNSSSLFDLGTHLKYHPDITVAEKRPVRTDTLDSFFKKNGLQASDYNVWVFDIQGGEYNAFKGSPQLLADVDIIQTEVSTEELYKGIGLLQDLDILLGEHNFKRLVTEIGSNRYGDAIYLNTQKYPAAA